VSKYKLTARSRLDGAAIVGVVESPAAHRSADVFAELTLFGAATTRRIACTCANAAVSVVRDAAKPRTSTALYRLRIVTPQRIWSQLFATMKK
jgi:hypothetical protein